MNTLADTQVARLQADLKNLCRTVDEVKSGVNKIETKLDNHRIVSAERAVIIQNIGQKIEDHELRLKKLEASFVKFALIVATASGSAAFGVDKLLALFH